MRRRRGSLMLLGSRRFFIACDVLLMFTNVVFDEFVKYFSMFHCILSFPGRACLTFEISF